MIIKIVFTLLVLLGMQGGYSEKETSIPGQEPENTIVYEIPEEYEATIVNELPEGFMPLADSELDYLFFETQISFHDTQAIVNYYQTSVKNDEFIVKYNNRYYINESIYRPFSPQTVAENFSGPLAEWLGFYQYEEVWQSEASNFPVSIHYHLSVYVRNDEVYARLKATGFQTNMDISARVAGDENKLELYSVSASGQPVPGVKTDELVLTLYKEDGVIKTNWGALHPVIEHPNGIYFEETATPWEWD